MTTSNPFELFIEDLKIEWTTLCNLRTRTRKRAEVLGLDLEDTQSENMAKPQRIMFEYARPSLTGIESSIIRAVVVANNVEIKPTII